MYDSDALKAYVDIILVAKVGMMMMMIYTEKATDEQGGHNVTLPLLLLKLATTVCTIKHLIWRPFLVQSQGNKSQWALRNRAMRQRGLRQQRKKKTVSQQEIGNSRQREK